VTEVDRTSIDVPSKPRHKRVLVVRIGADENPMVQNIVHHNLLGLPLSLLACFRFTSLEIQLSASPTRWPTLKNRSKTEIEYKARFQ
jgi:hypothetical protein